MPPRKPPLKKPAARRTSTARKTSQTRSKTGDGHVKAHTRQTKHGTVRVGSHDRKTRAQWKTAGNAWAGAGASGVLAIGLVFQLSFVLIAACAIVLAVTLKVVVYLLTGEDMGRPKRRRRTAKRRTTSTARRTTTRRRTR
ncbi:hypothetical protein [Actinomadura bangladeshensis]|uniref:Uncharacterized protein n=1 Tax=Actinomadura bangladeshensis TaxID=453573 RepID=A0A6L9QEM2_9ACTN|nr:hypothetical protein [Actinomadura bangladeshensis]NEA22624.1 hypothetical protein [Actinomadura bangladeshensis]